MPNTDGYEAADDISHKPELPKNHPPSKLLESSPSKKSEVRQSFTFSPKTAKFNLRTLLADTYLYFIK